MPTMGLNMPCGLVTFEVDNQKRQDMEKRGTNIKVVDKYEKYADIAELYSSKRRNVELLIPSNFRMLCAIIGIRPEAILHDFMWMVSYSSLGHAEEKQRKAAKRFFLACRFGQPRYSRKEIKTMFRELKAVRTVYDTTQDMGRNDRELFL